MSATGRRLSKFERGEVDWDSFTEVQEAVTEWANKQFPDRKPEHTLLKMYEEVGEYARDTHSGLELADVFILLLDLASMHCIDIGSAIRDKMIINSGRNWEYNPVTGLARHVKDKI